MADIIQESNPPEGPKLQKSDFLPEGGDAVSEVITNGDALEPLSADEKHSDSKNDISEQSIQDLSLEDSYNINDQDPGTNSVNAEDTQALHTSATDTQSTTQIKKEAPTENVDGSQPDVKEDLDTPDPVSDEDQWIHVLGHDKLKKKTVKKGDGVLTRPTRGQVVTATYSATLEDGTAVDQHDRHTFTLGDEEVIQALDLCISLMELHEVCEIHTEAQYAYGSVGRAPDIPADAKLIYTVELLVVEDAPDFSTLPVQIRITEADKKRVHGNDQYSRSEFAASINSYTRALAILDDSNESHSGTPEELQKLIDTRVKCYNNLAAAQLKVDAWDAAIKSSEEVLKVQPDNVKALFRKGKCLANKGDLEASITVLKKALKLEPETKIIHQELSRLVTKYKAQEASTRDMYKKMLGTDTTTTGVTATEQKSRWWLYVGGATLAAALSVGIAAYRYLHV